MTTERMAWLLYALEAGGVVDREAYRKEYFERMGRPCLEDPLTELGIEVVEVEGGTFWMGSPENERDQGNDEGPQHEVSLSPFRLGATPVTEGQYARFVESVPQERAAHAKKGEENLPVCPVIWWEAWLFCRWVGAELPTEAQWEFACRAGSQKRWCCGDDEAQLAEFAWISNNSGRKVHTVGEKKSNALGLFDMHGNVWEWCQDWHGPYTPISQTDPQGPRGGSGRVQRGGCFRADAAGCRSADRGGRRPGHRVGDRGFRVALPVPEPLDHR